MQSMGRDETLTIMLRAYYKRISNPAQLSMVAVTATLEERYGGYVADSKKVVQTAQKYDTTGSDVEHQPQPIHREGNREQEKESHG